MSKETLKIMVAPLFAAALLVGCANERTGESAGGAGTPGGQEGGAAGEAGTQMAGGTQTLTGVLLDANCPEIRNMTGVGAAGGAAGATGSDGRGIQDSSGGARTGGAAGQQAGDPMAGAGSAAGTRGGQGAAGGAGGSGAAGGAHAGGAGAGTGGTAGAMGGGERATGLGTGTMTLPAEYRNCSATPNTSSFALYADGRVLRISDASTSMVREQISGSGDANTADRSAAGRNRGTGGTTGTGMHHRVQVTGTIMNGELHATSVQQQGGAQGGGTTSRPGGQSR